MKISTFLAERLIEKEFIVLFLYTRSINQEKARERSRAF